MIVEHFLRRQSSAFRTALIFAPTVTEISPLSGQTYIALNEQLDELAKQTVLAHELGHFMLSPPNFGYFYIRANTNLDVKLEREANPFAVGLMSCGRPPELGETLDEYARRIGVPAELVSYLDCLFRS